MDRLVDHFFMAMSAPRRAGKSTLIKGMLDSGLAAKYEEIHVLCPSLDLNEDYEAYMTDSKFKFTSVVTRGHLKELLDAWMTEKKTEMGLKRSGVNNVKFTQRLVILDDCIDSGVLTYKGPVETLAERGRHFNTSVILTTQKLNRIGTSIRTNCDYLFFFSPFAISELEQFCETFVYRAARKVLKEQMKELFKRPFHFLVLDNFEKDTESKLKWGSMASFINKDWGKSRLYVLNDLDSSQVAAEVEGATKRMEKQGQLSGKKRKDAKAIYPNTTNIKIKKTNKSIQFSAS